jgi:hypothetical protein
MTLAAILLVGIFSSPAAQPLVASLPTAPQTTPAQNSPAPSQPASSATQTTPSPTPPVAKRPHHKKRVHRANCGTLPAAGQAASGSTPAAGDPASAAAPASAPANTLNCPPPKVIVRQGGTSEPSIQLAGGATGGQNSNQRDAANQMLDTTDANLKKLSGKQLTSNQQDMVSQTRQFMQQSKDAVEAGDLERARTLAWKAQVLSEELVKPEK